MEELYMKVAFSAFLLVMMLTGCNGTKQPNVENKNDVSGVPEWVNESDTPGKTGGLNGEPLKAVGLGTA
jgi:hypothetical protein